MVSQAMNTMVFNNFLKKYCNAPFQLMSFINCISEAIITHQAAKANLPPSTMKMFFCEIIKIEKFDMQSNLVLFYNYIPPIRAYQIGKD